MGPGPLKGGWGKGGVPMPGRAIVGLEDCGRNVASICPAHLGPRKTAGVLGWVLHCLRSPPAVLVLGAWGKKKSRSEQRGALWDQSIGGGKCGKHFPVHLGPREPAEVPGLISCTLRPDALWGPSGCTKLKPRSPHPQGLFWLCES